jgi:hypothetical protein
MNRVSVFPHTRRLDWALDQSTSFVEWGKADTKSHASDKITRVLEKKRSGEYSDASPESLFNEWGPVSDLMDYTKSPPKDGRGLKVEKPIPCYPAAPTSTNSWFNPAEIQARNARLIWLMTEAGWIRHMESIFIEQLRIKEGKGDHPPALYLSLKNIITHIFDFYIKKYQLLEFSENTTHQATFFQLMEETICDLIAQYYTHNPAGWNIEKRIQSLGDALYGFITVRKPLTKGQIEKYRVYLGEDSHLRLSSFEIQILRTIKEIEQIITSAGGKIEKKNALPTNLSIQWVSSQKRKPLIANYDPKLLEVFNFLKGNFLDLKYNRGDLYKISTGLYYLGKSIQSSAQPYTATLKKTPFWARLIKPIQWIFPKK